MINAPTVEALAPANQNGSMRQVSIFTIPVDPDTIFSNERGIYQSHIEHRQRRLIVKSMAVKAFLHPDELIRCITTALSPISSIEQDLAGPACLYFRKALLIFTDNRILHVPTRFNGLPRGAISQIAYKDCAGLQIVGHTLEVRYQNGKRDFFNHVNRMERKKLRGLISGLRFSRQGSAESRGQVYLCPRCTHTLQNGAKQCGSCNLRFKTTLKSILWTFFVPGGSFFYLRYPLVGIAAALCETPLIALAVFFWMEYINASAAGYGLAAVATIALVAVKMIPFLYSAQLVQDFVPEKEE